MSGLAGRNKKQTKMAAIIAQSPKEIFNDIIYSLMNTIDLIGQQIGDGAYLQMTNELMALMRFKNQIGANTVYVELQREVRRRAEGRADGRRVKPTLQEKLNNPAYTWCERCNTPVQALAEHQLRAKCSSIAQIKRTTRIIKSVRRPEFQKRTLFLNRFFEANYCRPDTPISKVYKRASAGSHEAFWKAKCEEYPNDENNTWTLAGVFWQQHEDEFGNTPLL